MSEKDYRKPFTHFDRVVLASGSEIRNEVLKKYFASVLTVSHKIDEEKLKELKKEKVKIDIEALLDLSLYVDRVSKRMKKRLIGDLEARIEEDMGGGNYGRGRGRGDADDMDLGGFDPPVWQNYEQMDDIERASLLERAIMVLAEDRSEAPKGGGTDTKKRINRSYRN